MSATRLAIIATIGIFGDGTTTEFIIDLLKDPYVLPSAEVVNWFSQENRANNPIDVNTEETGYTVSLSSNKLTFVFSTAPAAGRRNVTVNILF